MHVRSQNFAVLIFFKKKNKKEKTTSGSIELAPHVGRHLLASTSGPPTVHGPQTNKRRESVAQEGGTKAYRTTLLASISRPPPVHGRPKRGTGPIYVLFLEAHEASEQPRLQAGPHGAGRPRSRRGREKMVSRLHPTSRVN